MVLKHSAGAADYSAAINSSSLAQQGRRGGLWRGCRGAGEAGLKVPWFDGEVIFLFSSLNGPEGGIIV